MNTSNAEIKLYVDTLILETVLADPNIVKKADGSIFENIKNEVSKYIENGLKNVIDPEQKTASILSLLAPVAIYKIFEGILPGPIRFILALIASVFRVDIKDIFAKVYSSVSELISGGKKTTSAAVDNAVNSAIASTVPQPTKEHAKQFIQEYKKNKSTPSAPSTSEDEDEEEDEEESEERSKEDIETDLFSTSSIRRDLCQVRMLKLAIIDYEYSLTKIAATPKASALEAAKKSYNIPGIVNKLSAFRLFLGGAIGWIFKIALLAGGFFLAGDVVNKYLNRPSITGGTIQKGKPTLVPSQPSQPTVPKSTQTKFPLRKNYSEENYNTGSNIWTVNRFASKPDIENLILDFAEDVFEGLENKDSLILNNPKFKGLVSAFLTYNSSNLGTNMIIIPSSLHSKRQVVDMFIDDVAKSA